MPLPPFARRLLAALLFVPALAFAQAAQDPLEVVAPAPPAVPAPDSAPAVPGDDGPAVVAPATPAPEAIPLEEIQRYAGVFRAIKEAYVDPISDKELMRAALRGLLADLDAHSAYLEKDNAEALNEMTTGRYVGVGVELEQRPDHQLTVVAAIDGSPAAKAGLRTGDVIEAIDDRMITEGDLDSASQGLRGAPGSSVKLRLRRTGVPDPFEVVLWDPLESTCRHASLSIL